MKIAIAALDVLHSYPATPRMKNLVPYCRLSFYMEGDNSLAFSGCIDSIQYCHFQVISGIVSMATCTKRFCNKIMYYHVIRFCKGTKRFCTLETFPIMYYLPHVP
ncbi:hypothetical protein PVL29_000233 [Vitis rotundifolia]|uniref:Uncharacterized protein n=1 Tax=Vitis rotundifolia TaxID=103349 RepID=A0AA39AJ84_VITRO|nr:hypothetical protein PVL29_000233 [Vitis rotundifolia]